MKTLQLLTTIALLLVANNVWSQQEVYDRYMGRDDIDIVYVHGYWIDSLNKMDVILIRAKDSAGWEWMKEEFNFVPLSELGKYVLSQGKDVIKTHLASKYDPTKPMEPELLDNCDIKVSFLRKELAIFYFKTIEQKRMINKQLFK